MPAVDVQWINWTAMAVAFLLLTTLNAIWNEIKIKIERGTDTATQSRTDIVIDSTIEIEIGHETGIGKERGSEIKIENRTDFGTVNEKETARKIKYFVSGSNAGDTVSENSGRSLPPPLPYFLLHQPSPSSIRYLIPTQEADNALVTPLELRVFIGGEDYLLFSDSHARLTRDLL
ncbi:hypothetical protein EVAR_99694_1 [Eumeta japonica]|uniref:Uncharacterized protein n=1 Tax=Eumeta variegata TaxID=151549 RepID=A0A4C1YJS1_EUMVA|nr:hypothetical protein EVAR_99694_1 [Eumeta japonica]